MVSNANLHPYDVERWSFDVTTLSRDELCCLIFSLFDRLNLLDRCNVDRVVFFSFIKAVGAHYRDNAYHNWWHAADVTHSCYLLVRSLDGILNEVERFALLVAALCHDVDHLVGLSLRTRL